MQWTRALSFLILIYFSLILQPHDCNVRVLTINTSASAFLRTGKYSQDCTYEAIEVLFVVIANESPVFVVAPSSLLLKGGLRAFCRLIRARSAWVLCENNDQDDEDDDKEEDDDGDAVAMEINIYSAWKTMLLILYNARKFEKRSSILFFKSILNIVIKSGRICRFCFGMMLSELCNYQEKKIV